MKTQITKLHRQPTDTGFYDESCSQWQPLGNGKCLERSRHSTSRISKYLLVFVLGHLCLAFMAVPAIGQPILTANFDDLTEGALGATFTDGGITFSDLDQYFAYPYNHTFTAEWAAGYLSPPFTPPNVLNFGGYSPGPDGGFGRFGSCTISFGGNATSASVDVFQGVVNFESSPNILTLQAWSGTELVASSSISFATPVACQTLSVSASDFDHLNLVASGPLGNGAVYIVLDNVAIQLVPEPSGFQFLTLAALGLLGAFRPDRGE
jgi:hypothetical protein